MSRSVRFTICAALGLLLLGGGLLVPAHLRAVHLSVIAKAGRNSRSWSDQGMALVNGRNLAAAQLLVEAGRMQGVPDPDKFALNVASLGQQYPELQSRGSAEPWLANLTRADAAPAGFEPFTETVIRTENRTRILDGLSGSPQPVIAELLRFRGATNTVVFSPSASASGQPLDAALAIGGLLLHEGRLTSGLSNALAAAASAADQGRGSPPLELILLDLLSLGQRFNWGQLTAFVGGIPDAGTLRLQAELARKSRERLPVLFAAVLVSGNPAGVGRYLVNFSQTGLDDLGTSLRYGTGGVNELVTRNQQLYRGALGAGFAAELALKQPWVALGLKWFLYLVSGYFLALALHFAWPAVSALERPLQVRGFHVARELLFALGFLLVVLLLSEPFLARESQRMEWPIRLRLPIVGSAVPAGAASAPASIMNQLSLLTLLLFFVLQALLYSASLFKLAEIRRQRVPARIKLRLLENEDHLFDAGLYLGFVGTIISLILVSLGVIKPSLMAAYSSTSFGIIFVSIFKILNLRPVRRRLLLEAEAEAGMPGVPAAPGGPVPDVPSAPVPTQSFARP